jgi:hypothetical protein
MNDDFTEQRCYVALLSAKAGEPCGKVLKMGNPGLLAVTKRL